MAGIARADAGIAACLTRRADTATATTTPAAPAASTAAATTPAAATPASAGRWRGCRTVILTAVAVCTIPVVTAFTRIANSVPTTRDGAVVVAAIAVDSVPVVALFTRANDTVPAH